MLKKIEHMWRKLDRRLSFLLLNSVVPLLGIIVGNSLKTCEQRSCNFECRQAATEEEKKGKLALFFNRRGALYALLSSKLLKATDALLRLTASGFFTSRITASSRSVSG